MKVETNYIEGKVYDNRKVKIFATYVNHTQNKMIYKGTGQRGNRATVSNTLTGGPGT